MNALAEEAGRDAVRTGIHIDGDANPAAHYRDSQLLTGAPEDIKAADLVHF